MIQMNRLTQIESGFGRLSEHDKCWHIGEYQAHKNWEAGETNRWIFNLKIEVPTPPHRVRYKNQAVAYWAEKLAEVFNPEVVRNSVSFVPAPCSKPKTDPAYDDRMLRVLHGLSQRIGPLDIREAVVTTVARQAQHRAEQRSSPDDLLQHMALNGPALAVPLRQNVIVIDDVFTQGSTFIAMKRLLTTAPNVTNVAGVFLARTVWPNPFEDIL
jgi:predicted amidophosphoribosyltransferase